MVALNPDKSLDFTPRQRQILMPWVPISSREWAIRHRWVTEGPIIGPSGGAVPWSDDALPIQQAVMDAIDDRARWSMVVWVAPPQKAGKTDCLINAMLKRIQHDRRNCLYVGANEVKAGDHWIKKIRPAIENSPTICEILPEDREEAGDRYRRDFLVDGLKISLFLTGAESIANMSGSTVTGLIGVDDCHAIPEDVAGMGHPVEIAKKRSGSVGEEERSLILLGQAGHVGQYHWKRLEKSTRFEPHFPCRACGTWQPLAIDRLLIAGHGLTDLGQVDPVAAKADCGFRCANAECGHILRFHELPWMWSNYRLIGRGQSVDRDGNVVGELPPTRIAGFSQNAFAWPFVDWGENAEQIVEAQGDPDLMRVVQQSIFNEAWEEPKADQAAMRPEEILSHVSTDHKWCTIPAAAGVHERNGVVIQSVDVMGGYLWYLSWAWRRSDGTAWLIEAGRFGTSTRGEEFVSKSARRRAWEGRITEALKGAWKKEEDGWPILGAGGEELGRASALYVPCDIRFLRDLVQMWCYARNGQRWTGKWIPVEGSQKKASSRTPIWPGFGGMSRESKTKWGYWECNVNRAKLLLRIMLTIPPGEPGSLNLPADMDPYIRETFCQHLCAEEWDEERGVWNAMSRENHLLDDSALQIVGALAAGVKLRALAIGQASPAPKIEYMVRGASAHSADVPMWRPMRPWRRPATRRLAPMRRRY